MTQPHLPLPAAVTHAASAPLASGASPSSARCAPAGKAAAPNGTNRPGRTSSLSAWWRHALLTLAACMMAVALPTASATSTPQQMPSSAVTTDADDLETRVRDISHQLRCLVCQNQSIAESNAPLALDLRNQVRDMLRQGMDADAISRYMTDRYGDFVLYQPPLRGTTLLLWLGPFALLLAGMAALVRRLRRHAHHREPPLTQAQQDSALALLSPDADPAMPTTVANPPNASFVQTGARS